MNKNEKSAFFTKHHSKDVIHHWPAMTYIQKTAEKD